MNGESAMDKILQTQLVNIYNHIDAQSEEIEMAARLLAQAVHSEGEIFITSLHDIAGIENFLIEDTLSLAKARKLKNVSQDAKPDRVLVAAGVFNEEVKAFTVSLETAGV